MILLDVAWLILFVLSAIAGYRRGGLRQVTELLRFTLVAGVGVVVLTLWPLSSTSLAIVPFGLAVALLFGGLIWARRVGDRTPPIDSDLSSRWDRWVGVAVSTVALILATWFLALNFAQGPFPRVAFALRESLVVDTFERALPAPPSITDWVVFVAENLGFSDPFTGWPPVPVEPTGRPNANSVRSARDQAFEGVTEVLGIGCHTGFFNEGSGFVVAPGLVVTNAHVVAGTRGQFVYDGRRHSARVVAMDRALDLAMLYVPDFDGRPLQLATVSQPPGTSAAILGFPGGFPMTTTPAVILRRISVASRDIDGAGSHQREIYELQAGSHSGDSGAPLVLADGTVAGVVFSVSTVKEGVAYAITSEQASDFIAGAVDDQDSVDTGACVSGG